MTNYIMLICLYSNFVLFFALQGNSGLNVIFSAEDIVLQLEDGSNVTADYFQEHGFNTPVLIHEKTGLDLTVPPSNFTVYDVEQRIGE